MHNNQLAAGVTSINPLVCEWFERAGRHDLPWQVDDPYRVWVSEIMLQQTQVATVLAYYARFTGRFPDYKSLGSASWDEVAPYWAGLGYYARARNLHRAASYLVQNDLPLPRSFDDWLALPGIGKTTAGAIMALAFNQPGTILDGNVKRVLSRYYAVDAADYLPAAYEQKMWHLAHLNSHTRYRDYGQGIMDLGATLCTPKKPACLLCPLRDGCQAFIQGRQHELPARKKRAASEVRYAILWIYRHPDQTRIYMEQRADHGIWGGLWCFPLTPLQARAQQEAEQEVQQLARLSFNETFTEDEWIKHVFTHFTYMLRPVYVTLSGDDLSQLDAGVWERPEGLLARGVPAPLKKILT